MKFFYLCTHASAGVGNVLGSQLNKLMSLALGTYLDAQYKYLRVQSGFTLTCDIGIALGPRLELYPVDHGLPHRVTSQFPVSVYDARTRTKVDVPVTVAPASRLRPQGMFTVDTIGL